MVIKLETKGTAVAAAVVAEFTCNKTVHEGR